MPDEIAPKSLVAKLGAHPRRHGDIIGMTFGFWTILAHCPEKRSFLCRCACGAEKLVFSSNLYKHKSISCGCYRSGLNSKRWDLTGRQFRKLQVLRRVGKSKMRRRSPLYECRCDCGEILVVSSFSLLAGKTVSCGCGRNKYPAHIANLRHLYTNYRNGAELRGQPFELSLEAFASLISMDCHYCGTPPSNTCVLGRKKFSASLKYSGIDRIDSNKGYVSGNCAPCCKRCNIAKNDATLEVFLAWVSRVYQKQPRSALIVPTEDRCKSQTQSVN